MTCVEASDWLRCMTAVSVKNKSFHISKKYFSPPPETICNSQETELYLHLTGKAWRSIVMNFLETHFDTTLWSKLINSALSRTTFVLFSRCEFSFATNDFHETHKP